MAYNEMNSRSPLVLIKIDKQLLVVTIIIKFNLNRFFNPLFSMADKISGSGL